MRVPTLHRSLAALAALPLAAAVLTGCGSDDDGSSGAAGETSDADYVTGTVDDWLGAVCDGVSNTPFPDRESVTDAYGETATEAYECGDSFKHPGGVYSVVDAVLLDADPGPDWRPVDADGFITYAVGQVSEDQWAVVSEYGSFGAKIPDPMLEPLEDLGFEVVLNEPVR